MWKSAVPLNEARKNAEIASMLGNNPIIKISFSAIQQNKTIACSQSHFLWAKQC